MTHNDSGATLITDTTIKGNLDCSGTSLKPQLFTVTVLGNRIG